MNQVNNTINFESITKRCRNLDPKDLMALLRSNFRKFICWGAEGFTIDNKKNCRMFRMTVNGHLHKGFVYIFVNGADLFDVYLTTKQGVITKIQTDLYFDMLVDWIDDNIERIPEYKF